ncbi:MAG TPA: TetR/AcrR family transcriptional regulator, partial [Tepiditoga sp.]|nr:TetR/AcrR family transcriptional regulator [Tepiditoga sp.]
MKYSENITKQKIFENSVILFSEKGFDSVSMREIADSVGIRASSIYNHFKSKENILDEIFNYFVSELYDNKFPDGKKDAYNFIAMKIPLSDYLKSGMAVFADNHNSSLQNRIWKIITKNTDIKSKGFFIREMLKAPKNYWKDFFSVLSEKKII